MKVSILSGIILILFGIVTGCSRETVGGAAAGAAATGGAYEYQNKKAMDKLEEQRQSGEISEEEYNRRKKEIEDRSVVY